MALFGFGKKKEETQTPTCACGAQTETQTTAQSTPCCEGADVGICCIKVLGSGCKNCHALHENATAAVKALGLGVEVEYITDLEKVMEYGVMSMPGLVINDQVVSMGKVLKPADVEKVLKKFGA
jgi:small redox-active disulfide protein 2